MDTVFSSQRRRLLAALGAGIGAAVPTVAWLQGERVVPLPPPGGWATPPPEPLSAHFIAAERSHELLPGKPSALWTFQDGPILPILRVQRGQRLRVRLDNRLPEHTAIHWHGMRIANAMDGVPYVTQPPVEPGESFVYAFDPPDAGTFFFHPHCNTVEQLGRGMAGVLLVEGDEIRPSDAEVLAVVKDWRLADDGSWLPFLTDGGAARAGTFGTHGSVNGVLGPWTETVPANSDVRLRVLNVDVSRILEVAIPEVETWLLAVDGNPIPPRVVASWRLGPAQRIDLAFRMPATPGTRLTLSNYFAAEPVPLVHLDAAGPALERPPFEPAPLRPTDIPLPDVANAETLRFDFGATSINRVATLADGTELPGVADDLCLSDATFWAINRQSWPEDGHQRLPPPLAMLERGKSYVFELANLTPHMHPIHIHGHTFRVLESNQRDLPEHWADTVLLTPKERIRVAFKADNPGDWMFHCHIIEHQETGMMGYVRVV